MSLDPSEKEEILVTPQPRRSPQIGRKEWVRQQGGEVEEAKESSDEITKGYLSVAEEEEPLETIEEHAAGLDRILEYPGVEEEAIEIEEELVEDDSISSEESDFESSCGGTSSDSEDVGSGDSWSTYSFASSYTELESESK
uniref:Uncharacterized protein n=1 Tax=Pseudo-nitzschia australis TaxID=44445 RepID=A0A7S4EJ22_9STRA